LNLAKANKQWAIISFHELATSGDDIYYTTPANFSAMIAQVAASGLPVITYDQAIASYAVTPTSAPTTPLPPPIPTPIPTPTPVPNPTPTTTPPTRPPFTPAPSPGFPTTPTPTPAPAVWSGAVSAPSTTVGKSINITFQPKSPVAISNVNVSIKIYDPSGTLVVNKTASQQNFSAGQTRTYSAGHTPKKKGTYKIVGHVFFGSGSPTYYETTSTFIVR
jgi:hypothetical protein